MNNERTILVIVEGEKTEPAFLEGLTNAYALNFSICCVKTNIYYLYNKLKALDFNADIKRVILEDFPEYEDILSRVFVYTYLFFDCDAHHTREGENGFIADIVKTNIQKLHEMAEYFIDETDPTVGKLYINYPMMEAFRACNSTFEDSYKDEYVGLCDLHNFKKIVGTKKLVGKHLKNYSQEDFRQLTKMNVFKLNDIMNGDWGGMSYERYLSCSGALTILSKQSEIVNKRKQMAVLNTSLFFLIDYYGNKDGFYDEVVWQ